MVMCAAKGQCSRMPLFILDMNSGIIFYRATLGEAKISDIHMFLYVVRKPSKRG